MFHNCGIDTDVDLSALIGLSGELPVLLGHGTPGYVVKAGTSDRIYD